MNEKTTGINKFKLISIVLIIIIITESILFAYAIADRTNHIDFEVLMTSPFPGGYNGTYDGWVLNSTLNPEQDVYLYISDWEGWNFSFDKTPWYNTTDDFVPDFENYVYVFAYWDEHDITNQRIDVIDITVEKIDNEYSDITQHVLNIEIQKEVYSSAMMNPCYSATFVQIPKIELTDCNIVRAEFNVPHINPNWL